MAKYLSATDSKLKHLCKVLWEDRHGEQHMRGKTLVYFHWPQELQKVYAFLKTVGVPYETMGAKMATDQKAQAMDRFNDPGNTVEVMVYLYTYKKVTPCLLAFMSQIHSMPRQALLESHSNEVSACRYFRNDPVIVDRKWINSAGEFDNHQFLVVGTSDMNKFQMELALETLENPRESEMNISPFIVARFE